MDNLYLTKLLAGLHGDPGELEMINVVHRRVTIVWKDGANIRRASGIANNIVRLVKCGTVFETTSEEVLDIYNNRWIQIIDGYVCTFYNGTQRAIIEIIK